MTEEVENYREAIGIAVQRIFGRHELSWFVIDGVQGGWRRRIGTALCRDGIVKYLWVGAMLW